MPMTSTRRFDNTLGGTQRQEQCRRHFGGEPVGSHQWSSFSASATNTAVTVKQQYHSQRNQYSSPAAVPQSRQRSQRRQLATSQAVLQWTPKTCADPVQQSGEAMLSPVSPRRSNFLRYYPGRVIDYRGSVIGYASEDECREGRGSVVR